jgi:hypothetical protein
MTLRTAETASSAGDTIFGASKAGLAYMAGVFAVGFVLGTLRILVITPKLGELVAVSMELPIMLAVSWLVCLRVTAYFGVSTRMSTRLVVGGVAFVSLMAAETILWMLVSGRPLTENLRRYREWSALLGFAGQIAFSAIPILQTLCRSDRMSRGPDRQGDDKDIDL